MASTQEESGNIREVLSAAADIAMVLIGSGVLSLPWSLAQLGWVVGCIVLCTFVTFGIVSGRILAESYQVCYSRLEKNDPNSSYSRVVERTVGYWQAIVCRIFVYASICGTCVVYAITVDSSIRSVVNIPRVYCMLGCCFVQLAYCLFRKFRYCPQLTTFVSGFLCLSYPLVGSCIAIREIIVRPSGTGRVRNFGVPRKTALQKAGRFCMAVANVGFSFNYVIFAFQIQGSISKRPIKTMKIATIVGLIFTALVYAAFASLFYVTFGDDSPQSIFSDGTNYHQPKWLLGIANICVVLHLIGDYKEYSFLAFESAERYFGLAIWWNRLGRALFVIVTYLVAFAAPKFFMWFGVVGAISFFPLGAAPVLIYLRREHVQSNIFCVRILFGAFAFTMIMSVVLVAGAVSSFFKT